MIGTGEPYKAPTADKYRLLYQRDSAVRQPVDPPAAPEGADEATRKAADLALREVVATYENEWRVARDTQDWSPLIVEGKQPTYFVMRWIPRELFRRWADLRRSGKLGYEEGNVALVRLALVGIENLNWPGFSFPRLEWDERLHDHVVPSSLFDQLRRIRGLDVDLLVDMLAGQIDQQEVHGRPL